MWHDDYTQYEGYFENGLFNGRGRMIYRNGDYQEGTFKDGNANGFGKYFSYDKKIVYIGNFKNNLYNGEGELLNKRDEESFKYIGSFVNGLMDGAKGVYETDFYKYTGTIILY